MEGRFNSEVKYEAAKHGLDDVRKSGGSPITSLPPDPKNCKLLDCNRQ